MRTPSGGVYFPMNGYTQTAELLPTLEMVSGVLKSRPPTRRNPQGEGPFSVTDWGMFGTSTATGDGQLTGRMRRETSAAPRSELSTVLRLAARQRCPGCENFPPLLIQV